MVLHTTRFRSCTHTHNAYERGEKNKYTQCIIHDPLSLCTWALSSRWCMITNKAACLVFQGETHGTHDMHLLSPSRQTYAHGHTLNTQPRYTHTRHKQTHTTHTHTHTIDTCMRQHTPPLPSHTTPPLPSHPTPPLPSPFTH
ncbi:unnamed protein product [Camellia sinensis]